MSFPISSGAALSLVFLAACASSVESPAEVGDETTDEEDETGTTSAGSGGPRGSGGSGGSAGSLGSGGSVAVGGLRAPEDLQRVFVTSMTYSGDLGGVDGADDRCSAAAAGAGLSGEWHAYLGTATIGPAARLAHSTLPYVRLDGVQIASDWADLTDGELAAPIAVDETGAEVAEPESFVWTAATAAGQTGGGTCVDWTVTHSGGFYGNASAVDATWSHAACQPCGSAARLYCFEGQLSTPPT